MTVSNDFLAFILDQVSAWGGVTSRRMFGGAGLYRGGKMFGLIADDVAYLKVDRANKDKFIEAGASPFKPFPDKPITMPYYEIPVEILENSEELIKWAQESLAIQEKK